MVNRSRLGELLVSKGLVSPQDLRFALATQKQTHKPLGQVFISENMISQRDLTLLLMRQTLLRMAAAFLLCAASISIIGVKRAKADSIQDVPAKISVAFSQASAASYPKIGSYPALFGSAEKRSGNLEPFTKWTSMFKRFERELNTTSAMTVIAQWQENLRDIQGGSLKTMADRVNTMVNKTRYIVDSRNWGQSDYWATPVEFLQRGGDCEDYAITKYTALRAMGVPEERLRIAIVHDNLKNIPHAVLVVYTNEGTFILDNQNEDMLDGERGKRYRPIFSINRQAWWLHTQGGDTVLASAE